MRGLSRCCCVIALCLLPSLGAYAPASAQAHRDLITKEAVNPKKTPIPEEQIEGACGVALGPGGIYVSDYYHHTVDAFTSPFQLIPAGTPPEGPCGLAFDSKGALYANVWHESVVRLEPSLQTFDTASSTGVAIGEEDEVYVNDRTHVAVYDPSGVLVEEFGSASLGDAYGIAVDGDRVYVPDAIAETVQVFDAAVEPAALVGAISPPGGFSSLVDAAVTVDQTNGHVLVLDNLQPGFEHPNGAILEFEPDGEFLGALAETVIDGGPSGMAVNGAGNLYVTSGNSELANVFLFGPYTEAEAEATGTTEARQGAAESTAAPFAEGSGPAAPLVARSPAAAPRDRRRAAHRNRHRGRRLGVGVGRPAAGPNMKKN